MYMPYLMYAYAAALVMMLLGCRVAIRSVPGLRGMRLLVSAMATGLLTVILFAVRPYAPEWLTILGGNLALYASTLLIYCCVADTLSVRMRFLPWGIGLSLASIPVYIRYTWIHPALVPRILVSSGLCAVFAAVTASLFFRYRDTVPDHGIPESAFRSISNLLGWLKTSLAVLCTVRCVLTVLYPPADILHLDMIQTGFSYVNLLMYIGSCSGLIWLSLCAHRRDLQILAQTDSLTGLLNRRAFEEILSRELRRTHHEQGTLAVLLLDIDRFKDVNDSFGHHAGDEVLRRVSTKLREGTCPADTLARYGGEEFVMLLRDRNLEQAEEIAERLRAEVAALTALPGNVAITASIGVAASHLYDVPEQLLRHCDDALYKSKRGGRNLVTVDRSFRSSPGVAAQLA